MDLMDTIRRVLGFDMPHEPTDEQRRIAQRLDRIKQRQEAIDLQIEVLRADRRDVRSHR